MDILIVLLFISVVMVTGAILFFVKGVMAGDFDQGDRMALLPLEDDGASVPTPGERTEVGKIQEDVNIEATGPKGGSAHKTTDKEGGS